MESFRRRLQFVALVIEEWQSRMGTLVTCLHIKESLATLGASTSRKRPADQLSLAESVDRVQRYERI